MATIPNPQDWATGGRVSGWPEFDISRNGVVTVKGNNVSSNNELWTNLKLVNPHIEAEFESFEEFQQNLRDAAALLRGEEALKKLAYAFHPSYDVYVEDGLVGTFDHAEPKDFTGENAEEDDEEGEQD